VVCNALTFEGAGQLGTIKFKLGQLNSDTVFIPRLRAPNHHLRQSLHRPHNPHQKDTAQN
jgi:hypothetical protein